MADFYLFNWTKPSSKSFVWTAAETVDFTNGESTRCENVLVNTRRQDLVAYAPLEHPALFTEFARLPATRNALISFANTYGALGADVTKNVVLPNENTVVPGELLEDWVRELENLQNAFTAWQLVRRGKTAELKRRLLFTGNHIQWRDSRGVRAFCVEQFEPEIFAQIKGRERWKHAAMFYVFHSINENLLARSRMAMAFTPPDFDNATLKGVPKGLIGAIWLQFALAVTELKNPRLCDHCNSVFVQSRTDARFCSDSCRTKAYNKRRDSK